jgi:hypothetical protein
MRKRFDRRHTSGLWPACLASALVGAAGCPAGDDGGGVVDTGGGPQDGSGDDDGATTNVSGTGMVADTGGDTTGGPAPELVPARGIAIDWVEANQGVGVPIGQDGAWVGPQDRLARLLQNRVTLIRAFWTIPGDWEPREIEAHLLLTWPDGTEDRLVQTKLVEAESFIGDLDRVFYWGIEAERALPGLEYAIELYEHDPAFADGAPESPPYFPEVEGEPVLVGIEDSYQLIKVTVVPFNYDDGAGCATQPDTSEETMQAFEDLLYMQNPVDRVDYTLHAAIDWNTPLSNFGELNSFLSELRFEEGAPPEMYYYGLVDVCSGGLGGAGGQAFDIVSDPTMDLAYARVSSGLWLDVDWSKETFVHEVGHTQGRRHVACEGEGGPDPSYPHIGGDVGEWGFGVIDFGLRHPTVNKDYMTYCHPTWVGTWGWNKVQPFVETLSTWDPDFPGNGAPAGTDFDLGFDPYSGSLLVGTITADGKELWITVPGGPSGHETFGDTDIELRFADGRVATHAAAMHMLPDSEDWQVVMPLPEDFAEVEAITRVTGGRRHHVPRTAVREHHHQRTVRR